MNQKIKSKGKEWYILIILESKSNQLKEKANNKEDTNLEENKLVVKNQSKNEGGILSFKFNLYLKRYQARQKVIRKLNQKMFSNQVCLYILYYDS